LLWRHVIGRKVCQVLSGSGGSGSSSSRPGAGSGDIAAGQQQQQQQQHSSGGAEACEADRTAPWYRSASFVARPRSRGAASSMGGSKALRGALGSSVGAAGAASGGG